MSDVIVARMGREPNPAERALANARERQEVAAHKGRLVSEARSGGRWEDLSASEEDAWIGTALAEMEEFARTFSPSVPPPPPGGQFCQVEHSAA